MIKDIKYSGYSAVPSDCIVPYCAALPVIYKHILNKQS